MEPDPDDRQSVVLREGRRPLVAKDDRVMNFVFRVQQLAAIFQRFFDVRCDVDVIQIEEVRNCVELMKSFENCFC